jgi:transcriptional regulator with XRE-family HTH domain
MKDRIIAIRKTLKFSQGEFAARLGMKRAALSMIELGTNALTDKNIKLICMTYNVNEQWLRTGTGEMFTASPFEQEFFTIYKDLLPVSQKVLIQLAKELLGAQKKFLAMVKQGNMKASGTFQGTISQSAELPEPSAESVTPVSKKKKPKK